MNIYVFHSFHPWNNLAVSLRGRSIYRECLALLNVGSVSFVICHLHWDDGALCYADLKVICKVLHVWRLKTIWRYLGVRRPGESRMTVWFFSRYPHAGLSYRACIVAARGQLAQEANLSVLILSPRPPLSYGATCFHRSRGNRHHNRQSLYCSRY